MKISQQIPKPSNWQDFESLCKKLWGEIWQCQEISKNGRLGQQQFGIDIYGIPKGESKYYGIQCKGKDEYTHAQLTTNEIDQEITKAKNFKPSIKKLYFATTSNRDVKVQEYIRIKNAASIQDGSFEIHVFFWDDIIELLEENQTSYNYYVKSQNFKTNFHANLLFENGSNSIDLKPLFYNQKIYTGKFPEMQSMYTENSLSQLHRIFPKQKHNKPKINKSFSEVSLMIKNSGITTLENWKVKLYIEDNKHVIQMSNLEKNYFDPIDIIRPPSSFPHDVEVLNPNEIILSPLKEGKTLVGGDHYTFESFYIKPISTVNSTITVNWKLFAHNYNDQGKVTINFQPQIKLKRIYVKSLEEFPDESTIQDYIAEIDED